MDSTVWIILACAIATYLTRIGGYLILSRFGNIHPRVEMALDAVPTAVLAALVAPSLLNKSPVETISILVAGLVALRASLAVSCAAGLLTLVALRNLAI